jgi:hypothetical protein
MPTVKSVAASKAARAVSKSKASGLSEVEVKGVEEIDGGAGGVNGDLRRNV